MGSAAASDGLIVQVRQLPTRIQIVSLLARRGTPMNVGEIVAAGDVVQSTVSAHLKVLAEVRFRAGRAPRCADRAPGRQGQLGKPTAGPPGLLVTPTLPEHLNAGHVRP